MAFYPAPHVDPNGFALPSWVEQPAHQNALAVTGSPLPTLIVGGLVLIAVGIQVYLATRWISRGA
jgi:hypothetical protein